MRASTATSRRTPTTTRRRTSRATTRPAIRQLEEILRTAVVVEGPSGDVVAPGTIVEVRMEGDDDTTSYLVGSIEERSEEFEVLSTSSPLGPGAARARARRHRELRGPAPHVRGRDRERPARRLAESTISGEPGRARRGRARRPTRADPSDRLPGRVHAPRPRGHRPGAPRPARRASSGVGSRSTTRATRCSTSRSGSARQPRRCATRCSTPACRSGAARACSHAGSEMLLDGALVDDPRGRVVRAAHPRRRRRTDADALGTTRRTRVTARCSSSDCG